MLKRFQPILNFIKTFTVKLLALTLVVVLFCSCTHKKEDDGEIILPTDNTGQNQSEKSEIVQGGTMRIPMTLSPYSMHPLYLQEAQMRNIYSMIFEPLIKFNEAMEPSPCIAESWKYDESKNIWTIQLRTNVHWHNDLGELTGADVAYTINAILSDPSSIYHTDLSYYVQSVEGYGNTLIIHPKVPSYALIYALNIPVIPQSYYQNKDKLTKDAPLGSGVFKVESLTFTNGTKMVLSANNKWWKKLPYLEKIEAIGFKDTESILSAFKKGELDCVPTSLKTTENYEILNNVNEKNYLSHNYVFVAFNLQRNYVSNPVFRKAIAYSINKTDIINNVYLKKATGAEQPLFNDTSLSSVGVTRYDYNIIQAKELISELGYKDNNGDGYIDTATGPLTISIAVINERSNPIRLEAVEYIKKNLKAIGVNVNILAQDANTFKNTVKNRSYDMVLSGYYLTDTPNLNFIFKAGGSGNLSGYSSQSANNCLNNIDRANTLPELKTAVVELQKTVANELPQIGLFFEMNTLLFVDKLNTGTVLRETQVYSNVNEWHFTK